MNRIDKLNDIQNQAVEALLSVDHGTCEAATGIGKTFIFFKYLYKRRKNKEINKRSKIWFLAETNTRLRTLEEESIKFKEIYNLNPLEDFDIDFFCYQALPKGKVDIMCCDEVHNALSEIYKDVFKNDRRFTVCLSATIPRNLKVYRDDEIRTLTKGELLEQVAPVVFQYSLDQGVADGVLSYFQTTIVNHKLNDEDKIIPSKIKGKEILQTEKAYYGYRSRVMATPSYHKFYKAKCGREMARLLWHLPSKVNTVKNLLKILNGKTIIFGVELDILRKITPNVVEGSDDKFNNGIIDKFNSGKINVIASAKKLKQGITLEGVTNCILVSYYSQSWHTIQQLGRIVRFKEGKIANLYIIKTYGTLEDKWLKEMSVMKDDKGKKVGNINLNIVNQMFNFDNDEYNIQS